MAKHVALRSRGKDYDDAHCTPKKKTWNKNAKTCWFGRCSFQMGWFLCSMLFFLIPYRMLGVTFSWALYHYLVNRRCCPAKDLIKPQDSCDVRPRRVWIQRHRHDLQSCFFQWHIAKVSKKLGAVFLHVVIRKPAPDDRSTVTAAVVATVYSVGVLAARIAAGMACPLLVGLLH